MKLRQWLQQFWPRKNHRRRRFHVANPEHLEPRILLALTPASPEIRVNSATLFDQGFGGGASSVAADTDSFVAIWQSRSQNGSGLGIFARQFAVGTDTTAIENRLNTTHRGHQIKPTIASSGQGTFVAVWHSRRNSSDAADVVGQRFRADGTLVGSEFIVSRNSKGLQKPPSVAMNAAGQFVVAWTGQGPSDRNGVYVRSFDAAGLPTSDDLLVNQTTKGSQSQASVAMDSAGGFVVAWSGRGGGDRRGVYVRRFNNNGVATTAETRVQEEVKGNQSQPVTAVADDGRFLVAWRSPDQRQFGVFAQLFDATGQPLGSRRQINETTIGTQSEPSVAFVRTGGFVAAWQGRGIADKRGVFLREFDANGNAVTAELTVNETITRWQGRPSVATTGTQVAVVWEGNGIGDRHGVFGRVYDVTPRNSAEINPLSPITVGEGTVVRFNATARDASGGSLSWSLGTGAPSGASIHPTTGEFTWPTSEADGPNTFQIPVTLRNSLGQSTTTVSITVNEVNVAPELTAVPPQNVVEGQVLELRLSATDADQPQNSLVYSLVRGPENVDLDTSTGVFRWTPAESHGPGEQQIIVQVSDGKGGTDQVTFIVTVVEANQAPLLGEISDRVINEGALLAFTASASDSDLPADSLTYSLSQAPSGARIDPITGEFRWTPGESDGPGVYQVTIVVADGKSGSDSLVVPITVNEVQSSPVLATIGNKAVNEGQLLSFTASATDPDLPANTLRFQLAPGAPVGTAIDPITGLFTWTPSEEQGASTGIVTILVDDGTGLSDSETISIEVLEVNQPPVLSAIGSKRVMADDLLTFIATATDPDTPANNLTFTLDAGAPNGAFIDPATGVFTWTPSQSLSGSTAEITVRVTDAGSPELSDFETIVISIDECAFDDDLTGWTVSENGGSATGHGTVTSQDCIATLLEGDSFVTSLATSFTVPAGASSLSFSFEQLNFDQSDPSSINDAFEVALVDADGDSLVPVYAVGRESFFNISEDVGTAVGSGVTIVGSTVTVNMTGVLAGQTATLRLRLTNNDSDTGTSVRITNVVLPVNSQRTGAVSFEAQRFDSGLVPGTVDGTALGSGILAGKLYVNTNQLGVWEIDLTTKEQVQIAGGPRTSRGDFVAVAPNGSLLVTQSDQVARLTPPAGGGFDNFNVELNVSATQTRVTAGTRIVLTGLASSIRSSDGVRRTITHALVNGKPVDVLDSAGNIFTQVEILPGTNEFHFTAFDSAGLASTAQLSVTGLGPENGIDLSRFADTTGSFSGVYGRTSFDPATNQLFVDLATRNDGTFSTDVPLLVAVRNISDPLVAVVGADGQFPDGTPYFDFTRFVTNGRLAPGQTSQSPSLVFYNPSRVQFDYDLVFLGQLNEAPEITSLPRTDAAVGTTYEYDVDATDSDDDTLTYSLKVSPIGMFINGSNGQIVWPVTSIQMGQHQVEIDVTDGRGGHASQRFTVTAASAPPNRPPVITSTPLTHATSSDPSVESGRILTARVRDFRVEHPDFEPASGGPTPGLIQSQLGPDGTPVFANASGSKVITSAESFADWYHDVPGTNRGMDIDLPLTETSQGSGIYQFSDEEFFPIDNQLLDNDEANHNFYFTMQSSSRFAFRGGESLTFTADDDLWVFIDGKLVVDLGGTHIPMTATVRLDDLGLVRGRSYDLDVFFAERAIRGSSFTMTTSIEFGPDRVYRHQVRAFDADADDLTFRLAEGPTGMKIDETSGVIRWNPLASQAGNHSVTVEVIDGRGGIAKQSFLVCVQDQPEVRQNSSPIFTSTPSTNAVAGQTWSSEIRAQDAETADLAYSIVSAPSWLSITSTPILNSDGIVIENRRTITGDVPLDAAGTTVSITVSTTDGGGSTAQQTWTLAIVAPQAANTHPAITSTPRPVAYVGRPWSYGITTIDSDGDSVALSLVQSPEGMGLSLQGVLTWTPLSEAPSPVTVEIAATDSRGAVTSQRFQIDVSPSIENHPPSVTSTPSLRALTNTVYSYDLRASDSDGDELLWVLQSAPRGMSINGRTGQIRWTPDESQVGENAVLVKVVDAFGGESVQSFHIHVACNNLAPGILSVPPTIGITDRQYLYPVRAVDPDGDAITWHLVTGPQGMRLDPATGLITWTPTDLQTGTYNVVIEARDGNSAGQQSYAIVVYSADEPINPNDPSQGTRGNRAPVITSVPVVNATANSPYAYQVVAFDPDGDTPTFHLTGSFLAGMAISETGLITWPAATAVGDHHIVVQVLDGHGAITTQGYRLSVFENHAPEISSDAITTVTQGSVYRYSVKATDADGDAIFYRLDQAPEGMSVDRFGRILWPSSSTDTTSVPVKLVVTDSRGGSTTQEWTITPAADAEPPKVTITISSGGLTYFGNAILDQDTVYRVTVNATDNVAVSEVRLLVNGNPVVLDVNRSVTLKGDVLRTNQLRAIAVDSAGLEGTAVGSVTIGDPADANQPVPTDPTLPTHPGFQPSDTGRPTVVITSPEMGANVTNRVPIIGTVDDPENNLWYYRVYVGRVDRVSTTDFDLSDPNWSLLSTNTQEIHNGQIGTFDPSSLTNDPYVIAVAAFDVNGRGWVEAVFVNVEGNLRTGNFHLEFTDLNIPLSGIPVQVNRVYDTSNADLAGDFGHGWMLGVQDARILETAAIGIGGAFTPGDDKFVPGKSKVYLTNPEGKRVGFTYQEKLISGSFFGAFFEPYFVPDPGVYDTLTIDEKEVARGGILGALNSGINPEFYTLTTKSGLKYRYSDKTGLQTITDLNGNVVTFSHDGIAHSNGTSIQFVRDLKGRISTIIDPAGNTIQYQYNLTGDLVSVTNQAALTTRYEYLATQQHYLDQAFDSLNNRSLKAVYAPNVNTGVLEFQGVIDALGNRIDNRNFDNERRTGIIRDANGNETKVVYNDRGNVETETDPLGFVKRYEYSDPRNPDKETRIIDKDTNVTDREYDERGNLLENIERGPTGMPFMEPMITSYTYDAGNRVTSVTDARRNTTSYRYNDNGNLIQIINAIGDVSSFTYDDNGNVATFADFNKNTTRFSNYFAGQPRLITFADGTKQELQYNIFGQIPLEVFREIDGTIAQQRSMEYDNLGRMTKEILGSTSDGSAVTRKLIYDGDVLDWEIVVHPESLDANGNLLEGPTTPVANRKSSITDYTYDANKRMVQQIHAMGGITDFRYDAQGNRIALRDPVGNITTWLYDARNQPIEERDPLYWDDLRSHDAFFSSLSNDQFLDQVAPLNPGTVADPLYDNPSGASVVTNTGAPHVILTGYDAVGNRNKKIDRNGRRSEYEYDIMKDLTQERWYDVQGSHIRTLTYTYDAVGNMLTANAPDSSLTYTYNSLNQQVTADNTGTPNVPRVLLKYGYDPNGNITSTADNFGVTVESAYNNRNLLQVRLWYDAILTNGGDVDPLRFEFDYNADGRPINVDRYASLDQSNLIGHAVRGYDLAGRSTMINFTSAANDVLSHHGFTYDVHGRMATSSRAGVEAIYTHDLTGQLTAAIRSDGIDEFFSYDANGNRTLPHYSTRAGNRLETDGNYVYEYDGEGNRVSKTEIDTGKVTRYEYDHRNRLVRSSEQSAVTTDATIATYSYDAINHRQRIQTTDEETVAVYNHEQVWIDFNASGVPTNRYLYDTQLDVLLSIATPRELPILVNTDQLGSVVGHAPINGEQSTTFSYNSYGADASGVVAFSRFGFTGREKTSGEELIYFRTRYYDAGLGRFTTEDSIRFDSGETNLVRYVFNTPLSASDPNGKGAAVEYAVFAIKGAVIAGLICSEVAFIWTGKVKLGHFVGPFVGVLLNALLGRAPTWRVPIVVAAGCTITSNIDS